MKNQLKQYIIMEKSIYKELGVLGSIFRYLDEHETLGNIILILEAVGLAWAVLTYDFTTRI